MREVKDGVVSMIVERASECVLRSLLSSVLQMSSTWDNMLGYVLGSYPVWRLLNM